MLFSIRTNLSLQLLAGLVVFQSNNLQQQIPSFLKDYQALIPHDIPASSCAYIGVLNQPGAGRSLPAILTSASPDHEAGQENFNKIRALGPVVLNTVTPMKPVEFMTLMGWAPIMGHIWCSAQCLY